MSRSFCSPKEKTCVQGPPGIQGAKGSRGRRGQPGASGRKGSRGIRGEPGPHGKQGTIGPPGPKGEQGMKGLLGSKGAAGLKGDQGIMGPLGPKGERGIKGIPGFKRDQGVKGSIGTKGEQGATGASGPRGEKGVIGVRGHRGEQGIIGPPGAKGKQGIMGPPGPKGQQGYTGSPGQKRKQGRMGVPGPRGTPGAIRKPGEYYSPPKVVVSPMKQTIVEKHNAVFHCSVSGNPKPTVTWLDESGTSLRNIDGRLEVRDVTLDDAGEYTCIGRNLRGTASQTSILIVEGKLDDCYTFGNCQRLEACEGMQLSRFFFRAEAGEKKEKKQMFSQTKDCSSYSYCTYCKIVSAGELLDFYSCHWLGHFLVA